MACRPLRLAIAAWYRKYRATTAPRNAEEPEHQEEERAGPERLVEEVAEEAEEHRADDQAQRLAEPVVEPTVWARCPLAPEFQPRRPPPARRRDARGRLGPACECIRKLPGDPAHGQTEAPASASCETPATSPGAPRPPASRGRPRPRRGSRRRRPARPARRSASAERPARAPADLVDGRGRRARRAERERQDADRHERVALGSCTSAASASPESSAVQSQRITTVRRGPWPSRIRRWWRWSLSATANDWPPHDPPDERERGVEDRHAEDHDRDEQRREEEVGLAAELVVRAPADRDRGGREQQPEEQRAGVAHEDPGRVEVVGQEPDADARPRSPRRAGAMFEPSRKPGLEQPVGVEEQRGAGDDHDARRRARRGRR